MASFRESREELGMVQANNLAQVPHEGCRGWQVRSRRARKLEYSIVLCFSDYSLASLVRIIL